MAKPCPSIYVIGHYIPTDANPNDVPGMLGKIDKFVSVQAFQTWAEAERVRGLYYQADGVIVEDA